MLAEGDHRIELNCGSNIAIASADFSQVVQDGILIFRELPFINCTSIGEDEVWILHVLCEIINENGRLSSASSVLYRWNKDIQFTSSVGSFGIRKELPRLDAVIERINQDFSPAEAWRNDSDEKENVYISLHCELPLDEVAVADMIENMYMQCEFEGTGADSYFIYLIDEESNERFRLVFNTPLWESQYGENDYVVELVVIGDRPEQYFEALWKEFSSREFFTSRDFSVQNLNYLLNSAQNSDQGE